MSVSYSPLLLWAREVRKEIEEEGNAVSVREVAERMMERDHEQRHGFYLLNSGQMAAYDESLDEPPVVTHVHLRIMVIRFVAFIVVNEREPWVH